MATILVADDRPQDRDLLVTLLNYRGHHVLEAANGEEAFILARTTSPKLVISDVMMPHMDGYELVRQMRADPQTANIPVLFYSATYLPAEMQPLADSCGVRVLTKPSEPERILRVVDEVLAEVGNPPAAAHADPDYSAAHLRLITDKLVETQEQLMLAVQGSNVGLWSWDIATNTVTASPQLKALQGYGDDEYSSSVEAWTAHIHPDDRGRTLAALQACVAGKTPHYEAEYRLKHKDGTYRWILSRGVCHRDPEGRAVRMAGTRVDISRLKLAEAQARDRERHSSFVADVAVALTEGDELREMLQRCAEAMVTHLGAALARIWTLNTAEPMLDLEASAGMYTHLDGAHGRIPVGRFKIGRIAASRQPHVTNQVSGDPEVPAQDWVKQEGIVSFAGYPLLVNDQLVGVIAMFARRALSTGTLDALAAVARTVALGIERKRTRQALMASEARARFALEAARAVVWETDLATGRVTQMGSTNPGEPLPFERAEGTVDDFVSSVHPDDQDQVREAVENAARRPGPFVLLFRRIWPDGSIHWVESRGETVLDSAGVVTRVHGIAQDVTARHELEDQLQQAQKIEGVGQLAGGLAHDFNNLLTVVLSYSALLADQFDPSDPRRQDLDQIHKAGTRAAQLTRQLLAFSRRQILQPVVLNLNDLISGISPMLQRLLGEHITLAVTSTAPNAFIKFDPGQMELILVNLTVNARDAMPDGGKFTLDVSEMAVDDQFAKTHLAVGAGRYVRLSMTDTGTGMDSATLKRIFEPFFTTKPRGKGTGLGLATVFGIVKQSGGFIWVYSEPGLGTTFRMFMPLVLEAPEPVVAAPATAIRGGHETILLVEDESTIRLLVETVLTRAGFHVITAAHPRDAIRIASDPDALIDLLLTDVVMPDMSGPALALHVLEARPGLRVLFMSGFADDTMEHHGVLKSGAPLLQKPFTTSDLTRAVRDVLDAPARTDV